MTSDISSLLKLEYTDPFSSKLRDISTVGGKGCDAVDFSIHMVGKYMKCLFQGVINTSGTLFTLIPP